MATHPLMHDLEPSERPRERLFAFGPHALGDAELLAILLRTGRRGCSALEQARRILNETDVETLSTRTSDRAYLRDGNPTW